jgi:hypothetical protein
MLPFFLFIKMSTQKIDFVTKLLGKKKKTKKIAVCIFYTKLHTVGIFFVTTLI